MIETFFEFFSLHLHGMPVWLFLQAAFVGGAIAVHIAQKVVFEELENDLGYNKETLPDRRFPVGLLSMILAVLGVVLIQPEDISVVGYILAGAVTASPVIANLLNLELKAFRADFGSAAVVTALPTLMVMVFSLLLIVTPTGMQFERNQRKAAVEAQQRAFSQVGVVKTLDDGKSECLILALFVKEHEPDVYTIVQRGLNSLVRIRKTAENEELMEAFAACTSLDPTNTENLLVIRWDAEGSGYLIETEEVFKPKVK